MNTPKHSTLRCRCGHQVLGRELLRTTSFHHPSGREVVYLKYRCLRCKKLGEAFIPREQWNPEIFQTPKNEMGALERDRFLDTYAISSADVVAWSRSLQKVQAVGDLGKPNSRREKRSRGGETKHTEIHPSEIRQVEDEK